HRVPASDYSPAPGDRRVSSTGERSVLLCMALHSTAIQSSVCTVKHSSQPYSKTAQLTL
ncbi:unnamed protein product, partial [Staurois parvus]